MLVYLLGRHRRSKHLPACQERIAGIGTGTNNSALAVVASRFRYRTCNAALN